MKVNVTVEQFTFSVVSKALVAYFSVLFFEAITPLERQPKGRQRLLPPNRRTAKQTGCRSRKVLLFHPLKTEQNISIT